MIPARWRRSPQQLAGRQAATLICEAYAGVDRAFCVFLGADAGPEALTPEAVRAYRGQLGRHGRSPATIATHLSALRTLASELGVERVRDVRGQRVARGEPRALTAHQYARLLRMPDLRSTAGNRGLEVVDLLGTAGLRRAEACALVLGDVDERRRASDGRLRRAIPRSTSWWVTVQYGKRGRRRAVPLEQDALDAIAAWVSAPPTCAHERTARLAAENWAGAGAARRPRRADDAMNAPPSPSGTQHQSCAILE